MDKKIYGSVMVLLAVSLIVSGVVLVMSGGRVSASGIEIVGGDGAIRIDPSDRPLFTMNNMSPGDSQSSPLTVRNEGEKAFTFSVSAVKERGADLLFDGLILEVAGEDGTEYYRGPLSGLDGKEMGKVAGGGSKDYVFTITFPRETANEAQGATMSMKFVFTATGPSDNEHHDSKDDKDRKDSEKDELIPIAEPEEIIPDLPEEIDEPLVEEPIEIIPDAPVVPAGELPKTGEFPPGVIHAAGLLLILAGMFLLRKQFAR